MRHLAFGAALCALATAPAFADETCARGEDVRVIEVLTPGEVGAACDLRYTRDGGSNVSVPYHADNASDFCSERARALVASLVDAGFTCTPQQTPPALREVREREFDIEDILADAETAPDADEPELAVAAPPAAEQESLAEQTPAQPVLEQPAYAQAAPGPAAQDSAVPAAAQRGPTALAPANVSSTNAEALNRQAASVGRLVGASPDAPPLTSSVALQQDAAPETATPEPAQPVEPATAAPPPAASEAKTVAAQPATPMKTRPAPDLIRAVLAAQAAAWNDGDLDDFMAGYWKSPNLRFVSGATVTKGWEPTLKRYREQYGTGAALGHLSFENVDVQMLNTDVAVVVGRFNLVRADKRDSGAFTLVMQRFDGLWRIVHDHSVEDAPAVPALTATASQ